MRRPSGSGSAIDPVAKARRTDRLHGGGFARKRIGVDAGLDGFSVLKIPFALAFSASLHKSSRLLRFFAPEYMREHGCGRRRLKRDEAPRRDDDFPVGVIGQDDSADR